MTTYRIEGLPLNDFEHFFGLSEADLHRSNAVRVWADEKPGFPCRVTLEDAEPGESLILLNYEHQPKQPRIVPAMQSSSANRRVPPPSMSTESPPRSPPG